MITHNLKQIFRSLWKYKSFSIINLLGLSIGIAAVVLIFLIADYEKNFDRFYASAKNIYRVVSEAKRETKNPFEATAPYPMAKMLRNEYPGLKACEIHYANDANVRIGNQTPFAEENVVFADSLFFSVFDFSSIKNFVVTGDPVKALSAPGKVILTESRAKKYFGSKDPVGQLLKIDTKLEVEVEAVIKDLPPTTHLPFNMLISFSSLTNDYIGGLDLNSWGLRGNGYCYVKADNNSSIASVEKAVNSVNQKNSDSDRDKSVRFYLQPIHQIHFDPTFDQSNPSSTYTVSPKYLMVLLLLGAFIILIACINYINLSTSLAFTKSKEVGIRKTIGASKLQLFFHYMSETVLLTTIAAIIGLVIAALLVPLLNRLLEKSIAVEQLMNIRFIALALLAILLISFISGIYPALILSGFKPIESIKNQLALPGKSSTLLRKGLVVFQFTISVALIICTLVIWQQMKYFNSKSLGFNKDAVVEVALPSPDSAKIESLRSLLQNQPGIQNLSFCLGAPISDNGISTSFKAPELPEKSDFSVKILASDRNYLATYGIQLLAGRWFLPGEEKNLGTGLVVNEALVKTLGYKNPSDALGKKIYIGINEYNPPIIGVVKDFHTSSLHQTIGPVALMPFPYFYYAAGIRVNPGSLRNTLASIESAYKKVYPEYVFNVSFIDEQLEKAYKQETKDFKLFKAFSGISIFICCIGLWGLIAFVVVRKTKEIGIRKVLGASISNIVGLLSKDFLKLVVIALIVASPIAWYFMHQWLENFAYRIDISWWMFGLAGLFAVVIALLTISFQAVRAALSNPVKNLRTE